MRYALRYALRYACHLSKVTQATVLAKMTLFARFEAREAERRPNIFPSCSARKRERRGISEKGRNGTNGAWPIFWGWGCWWTPLPWLLNMLQVAEAESR